MPTQYDLILKQIENEDILLITPNFLKLQFLKGNKKLRQIKYMTLEEYKSHYFFSWNDKTLDYLMSRYSYHLDFCKIILSNLYFIDRDMEYSSEKLNLLKKIKIDLDNKKLLQYDSMFQSFIKNKKIVVYGYETLEKYEEEMFTNAIIIKLDVLNTTPNVIACKSLEDEIIYICEEILKLYKNGVPLSKIYLGNVQKDYLYLIYKMFSYYKIPINIDMQESIFGTNIVKEYLKSGKLPGFVNPVVQKLVGVCSSLVGLEDSKNYKSLLIDKLKNTKISSPKYIDAVQTLDKLEIIPDDCYLLVLGFNQDVLPIIYKDEDYISDRLKNEVLLYTTKEKNIREREWTIKLISNIKNCTLLYHERTSFQEFLPSSLISDLGYKVINYSSDITNSDIYNKLRLGACLDTYYKYKEKSGSLIPLVSHYDIPYNTYDNKFTYFNKEKLYNFIDHKLRVSYTSLNSYNLCPFQYYINYILRIDPFSKNFSTEIGNLFHYIFSIMDSEHFNFEREWNNYIEKLELSISERFFLDKLKTNLKNDIVLIKDQDILTRYKNKLYEKEVDIFLDKAIKTVFTGKIDKVMYQNINGFTELSIIDYKTGSLHGDFSLMKYGLNMQLPIYLYLIDQSGLFENPLYSGVYLQKVLYPRYKFDASKDLKRQMTDDLKLAGYSTDNMERLSNFDKTYENSELIKGMKLNKDGSFYYRSKILSDQTFTDLIDYTKKTVSDTTDKILDADFKIEPKVIDQKNLSCVYCKYQDLCFKTNKDLKYLEKVDNLDFLGGDSNGN